MKTLNSAEKITPPRLTPLAVVKLTEQELLHCTKTLSPQYQNTKACTIHFGTFDLSKMVNSL